MTDPAETIVCDSARKTEGPSVRVVELPTIRSGSEVEFLDEAWEDEFDRRLAAWQAESGVTPSSPPPQKMRDESTAQA